MVKGFFPLILLFSSLLLTGCDSGPGPQEVAESSQTEEQVETAAPASGADISLALEPAQMDWVGQKIFQNECAGKLQCLVHWNEGEAFPSLGIGHFIWYPSGVDEPFVESFPTLIKYMTQRQASVPDWLVNLNPFDAPWANRQAFLDVKDSTRIAELREFLAGTQGVQAEFIFRRARDSLDKVIQAAPRERRDGLRSLLTDLSSTPGGVYALMDYVNFKGEGLAETERYQGKGWGLLQVLLMMDTESDKTALTAFREAAGEVLTRRAQLADDPIERERWLPGWLRRLDTYREPPEATKKQ